MSIYDEYRKSYLFPRLRGRLTQLGMTQKYLAKELGIGFASLNHRMNGKYPWNLDEAYKVCEILDIPKDEIYIYFPPNGVEPEEAKPEKPRKPVLRIPRYSYGGR